MTITKTYVTKGSKTASGLQEPEANVRAEVRPWRHVRAFLEDAHELGKDERDEEVDDPAEDHHQHAKELQPNNGEMKKLSRADHKTGNVVYALRAAGARSSSMATDKAQYA